MRAHAACERDLSIRSYALTRVPQSQAVGFTWFVPPRLQLVMCPLGYARYVPPTFLLVM